MTTALEGGEGSASRPGRSLLPGKTPYPLYRRLGGPQGRSGHVRKISPPTGIRSPDRPACNQSLYRLSYRAHLNTHFKFNNFFFVKIVPFMRQRKNIVELDRPQITIWRMRIACWISEASNTHSEYVMFIAFPLQRYLNERASALLHTHIACFASSFQLHLYVPFCLKYYLGLSK